MYPSSGLFSALLTKIPEDAWTMKGIEPRTFHYFIDLTLASAITLRSQYALAAKHVVLRLWARPNARGSAPPSAWLHLLFVIQHIFFSALLLLESRTKNSWTIVKSYHEPPSTIQDAFITSQMTVLGSPAKSGWLPSTFPSSW